MHWLPLRKAIAALVTGLVFVGISLITLLGFPFRSYAQTYSGTQVGVPISLIPGQQVDVADSNFVALPAPPQGGIFYTYPSNQDIVVDLKTNKVLTVPHSVSEVLVDSADKIPFPIAFTNASRRYVNVAEGYGSFYINADNEVVSTFPIDSNATVTVSMGGNYVAISDSPFPISSAIPDDIPGGAANANLSEAAVFAWQEFIALNWPAVSQNDTPGQPTTRDTADPNKLFGQDYGDGYTHPLVWETFRAKVETYPGMGSEISTSGTPTDYDLAPDYSKEYSNFVPACSGTESSQPAWVNLDETNEIGRAFMYAGVVDLPEGATPNPDGVFPEQQFLYLAKTNKVEYDYVTQDRGSYWNLTGVPADVKELGIDFIGKNHQYPPMANSECPNSDVCVSLPNGTFELKSAWRQLNSDEKDNFHVAPVRFYSETDEGGTCYIQSDHGWGMGALHINHKTPSAPYFIFTTFSQADNIVTEDGQLVENENGVIIANQDADPTSPNIVEVASLPQDPNPEIVYEVPAQLTAGQDQPSPQVFQPYQSPPLGSSPTHAKTNMSLYYRNTTAEEGSGNRLPQFPITVNKRQNSIPDEVIAVNALAHDAIEGYSLKNRIWNSPWLHYKLVNVQYKPINKAPSTRYTGPEDPGTYYLSNDVVETDYNLQFFSGQFDNSKDAGGGLITDFATVNQIKSGFGAGTESDPGEYYNIVNDGDGYNMGGCMGCHGVAANAGTNFSFILFGAGNPLNPEELADAKAALPRNTQLFEDLSTFLK